MMIDKSNHGQVGEALYVKMTLIKFNEVTGNNNIISDKTVLTPDDFHNGNYGGVTSVPIYIDNDAHGDYEVVCKYGIEVREWE